MLVLGIDPGIAITGYGVIKEDRGRLKALEFGAVRTSPSQSSYSRLDKIFRAIEKVIDQYSPDSLAVEQLFFSKNAQSAMVVGQARGVVLLAGARRGLDIREYTPLQVKTAVTGYGSASKEQVQAMVKALLGLDSPPRPDDVADALAVAVCCIHTCSTERRMGLR